MQNTPRRPRRTISIDGFLTPAQPINGPTKIRRQALSPKPAKPVMAQPVRKSIAEAPKLAATIPSQKFAEAVNVKEFSPRRDKKVQKRRLFKRIGKRVALVMVALIVLSSGTFGWILYRNVAKITKDNNPFQLLSAFKPVTLKGEDSGHVNILLAGNSTDDPGHDGANLTDSIMVLSLNTRDHSAYILSIPRDLWVDVPGMGYEKINAAATNTKFSANGYPNGGMGQLESVITDNLGININYYALIDYTAFRDAVNAVGGITIDIESPDPRGLYDSNIEKQDGGPLKMANGVQNLNGQQALNLARARGDGYHTYGFPGSDFDRTMHQRQMLLALKTKAASSSVLSDPVKIAKLANALGNNITTDMKLNEMETFYSLTKDLSDTSITSYNINNMYNKQMLANFTSSDGQAALIPAAGVDNFADIQAALKKLNSSDPVVKESASVVVLNGGSISGLAKRQGDSLTAKGLSLISSAQAPASYTKTLVIDDSGGKMPATKAALQKLYGVTASSDATLKADYPSANFIVVLGANFADPAASSSTTATTTTTSTSSTSH